MKKRGLGLFTLLSLLSLFFLLNSLSVLVYSAEPLITHMSKPKIELDFGEPVNVVNIVFSNIDLEGVEYTLSDFNITYSDDRTNVTIKPYVPFENGLYTLNLLVEDLVKNQITYTYNVLVDVPITDIIMVQPRLQMMNSTIGDIIINTKDPETHEDKVAYCKYAHLLGYSLQKKFEVASEFDSSNSSYHVLKNYDFSLPFNKNLYVICKDSDDRINYKFFKLDYDVTPPKIVDVVYNPPQMITLENNFSINVTTNENAFCYFYLLNNKYFFNNYTSDDEFDVGAYTLNHDVRLLNVLPDKNGEYPVTIVCQDRALWKTQREDKYIVDLNAALRILVNTPKPFTSKTSFKLDFFTNKPSYCQYNVDSSSSDLLDMTSTPAEPLSHQSSLSNIIVNEGEHNIHIECVSDSAQITQYKKEDYKFVVDLTPPNKLVVSGSNYSCVNNTLEFDASAFDNESGIDYYMYMVESGGIRLLNWTKSESSHIYIKDERLNSTPDKLYFITVEAYNRAGLKSTYVTKTIRFDATGLHCDNEAPFVFISKNESFGSTYVTINCTDNSGSCLDLKYGLSETTDCYTDLFYYGPFVIDKDYVLCYHAVDPAGNIANGTINVSVYSDLNASIHCSDGIFESDYGETDIDCGGDCFGCSNGKSCLVNSDCLDKFCLDNVCVKPTCDDSYANGDETDVDCGGSCVNEGLLCSINQKCFSHTDCASGYCSENYTCQEASCSDDVKNSNESDVDCGGNVCDACLNGKVCNVDDDCESKYCLNNICVDYKKKDSDKDGLPDWWEKKYFNCVVCADPNDDVDKDGLSNLEEYKHKTNPIDADTDGDHYKDGYELKKGYDPLDARSHPVNWFLVLFIFTFFSVFGYINNAIIFDYFKPYRDKVYSEFLLNEEKKKELELKKSQLSQSKNLKKSSEKVNSVVNSEQSVSERLSNSLKNRNNKNPHSKLKSNKLLKHKVDLTKEHERSKIFSAFKEEKEAVKSRRKLSLKDLRRIRKLKRFSSRKSGLSKGKNKKINTDHLKNSDKNLNLSVSDISGVDKNSIDEKILSDNSSEDDFDKLLSKVIDKNKINSVDNKNDENLSDEVFDKLDLLAKKKIKSKKTSYNKEFSESVDTNKSVGTDYFDKLDNVIYNKSDLNDESFFKRELNSDNFDLFYHSLIDLPKDKIVSLCSNVIFNNSDVSLIIRLLKKLLLNKVIDDEDISKILFNLYSLGKLNIFDYQKIKEEFSINDL